MPEKGRSDTRIVKVRRGRKTYEIPVDQDGFVPMLALIERFQEVGDIRRDRRDLKPLLAAKVRPEDVIEWWADPKVCDIPGIDTPDAPVYSVPKSILGRKRRALECVAVISDRDEADRIKKILARSFSAEELETITGIGPVLAQAILDYRAEHGDFQTLDELLEVRGIGSAKLDAMRDEITTGGDAP